MNTSKKARGAGVLFFIIVMIHLLNAWVIRIDNAQVSIIVTQLLVVVPALVYMLCWRENPFRFMRFKRFRLVSALLIPIFMLCLLPVMGLINAISLLFSSNYITDAVGDITGGNLLVGLLLVALLPAFVEETTFRGAIYHSLRGARPVRAIVLSGFIFGAMHMNFNQFAYATVLGIVMGFLLEATGSIVSTMILHFCFNGNSVIMMYLLPKLQKFSQQYGGQSAQLNTDAVLGSKQQMLMTVAVLLPVAAVGVALAFLLYMAIAKLNGRWDYIKFLFSKKTKAQRETLEKPQLANIFLVAAFIICFAICLMNELVTRGILHLG